MIDNNESRPSCIKVQEAISLSGIDDVTGLPAVKTVFLIVYSMLFLLGLIGNGGVITTVARNRRLHSARNILLLNLMFTDLLLCFTTIPVTPWYGLQKTWQFGSLLCRLMPLAISCSVFVTSWSLTAIAVDKFVHILDATRAPIRLHQAGLITGLLWLVCTVVNVPYLLSYRLVDGSYYVHANRTPFCGQFCDELSWDSDLHRRSYGTTVMLLQFVVPMAIITYCYARILCKVRRDMIVQNRQFCNSLSSSQLDGAIRRRRKVNYILIAMVATFVAAWFPLTLVNILKDFDTQPSFMVAQPYLWPLMAHAIAMSLVVWNPVLFFWLTSKRKVPVRLAVAFVSTTADVFNQVTGRVVRSRTCNRHSSRIPRVHDESSKCRSFCQTTGRSQTERDSHSNGSELYRTKRSSLDRIDGMEMELFDHLTPNGPDLGPEPAQKSTHLL